MPFFVAASAIPLTHPGDVALAIPRQRTPVPPRSALENRGAAHHGPRRTMHGDVFLLPSRQRDGVVLKPRIPAARRAGIPLPCLAAPTSGGRRVGPPNRRDKPGHHSDRTIIPLPRFEHDGAAQSVGEINPGHHSDKGIIPLPRFGDDLPAHLICEISKGHHPCRDKGTGGRPAFTALGPGFPPAPSRPRPGSRSPPGTRSSPWCL